MNLQWTARNNLYFWLFVEPSWHAKKGAKRSAHFKNWKYNVCLTKVIIFFTEKL